MTNEEKIQYINEALKIQAIATRGEPTNQYLVRAHFSKLPKFLYKYKQFDDFTEEMLKNEYLFCCQAKKLDDPEECTIDLDYTGRYDEVEQTILPKISSLIAEKILEKASPEAKEPLKTVIKKSTNEKGNFVPSKLLQYALEYQEKMPNTDVPKFVNFLSGFADWFEQMQRETDLTKLLNLIKRAREDFGICSLSESPNNERLWNEYSKNGEGYCIEYNFENDVQLSFETFPVVYTDQRNNNIFDIFVNFYLTLFLAMFSYGYPSGDISEVHRLFLTKNAARWSYQNEWRVLGDANQKKTGPKITAIYLGRNASKENVALIKKLQKEKGFKIIRRK